jgi:hypothetical protein
MAAGLAAASPGVLVRWGDASGKLMVLRQLALEMNSLGTGFTAGLGLFELVKATAFTVADTGGTAITPAAGKAKRRTAHADSAITDLRRRPPRRSPRARARSTRNRSLHIRAQIDVTANKVFVPALGGNPHALLFEAYQQRDIPLVLAQDEGFIIRATVPATGTWEFRVLMEWQEVNSY